MSEVNTELYLPGGDPAIVSIEFLITGTAKISGDYQVAKPKFDEQGLYYLEIRLPTDDKGVDTVYAYTKAGDYGPDRNITSDTTFIELVDEEQGVVVYSIIIAELTENGWEKR